MSENAAPRKLWLNWLTAVSTGVIAFGLLLVLAQDLARQGFSLLVYAEPTLIDSFGDEQVRYVSLAHAVWWGGVWRCSMLSGPCY
jgi:hypothetical protein